MAIRWPLFIRRTHKWLALFVGVQAAIWAASGMYMVAVHIDYIHGDHLVRTPEMTGQDLSGLVPPADVAARDAGTREVKLQQLLGKPVWKVSSEQGAYIVDARSGERIPELDKSLAVEIASSLYTGEPEIVSARLLDEAPQEMGSRKPPFWRIQFEGWNEPTFYISPTTGELIGRRHNLWRIFDIAWMLHIMDYDERSDVNNPLLRVATWSVVAMALAGAWLLYWSFPRRKKKKKVKAVA
ncbi:hypothetical protein [Sphingomicrobium lutaoense]|uniref:Putative iron-regulated membrane protein n=1 Tax=Sphingomicrobium lutaoense TaxID=515949 RepID=A0A839Z1K6_9SPHN|nr:hypothetical protein [Sphingomicrobium lutaoense]MBB3764550.1 putative iron-regulated membrane protein [Sphingomicrobium lutaoense]